MPAAAADIKKAIAASNRRIKALQRARTVAQETGTGSIADIDRQIADHTQNVARLEGCLP